jgi:hypothetical protein
MAPDFVYLLRLAPRGLFGHTLVGLFAFCLPVGLATYAAYERIVRPAIVRLLPPGLQSSLRPVRRALVGAAIAILIGAISHIVWDDFTHEYGWAVVRLPALREPVFAAIAPRLRWFKVLQHGSTVVGSLVVFAWAAAWVARQQPEARRYPPGVATARARQVALLLAAPSLAAIANAFRGLPEGAANALGYAAVGAMSGLAIVLFVYGLWMRSRLTPVTSHPPTDRTYSAHGRRADANTSRAAHDGARGDSA